VHEILNIIQTIAIVGSLALTLVLAAWNHSTQLREQDAESNQRSAELTLNLSEALDSGQAKVISMALDMDGNLDKIKVSDEEIEEFLDHYEDVAIAYRHGLIDRDMANDAFSYDLQKALRDTKIRRLLSDAIGAEAICTTACLGWRATSELRSLRSCRLNRLLALRRSPSAPRSLRSGAPSHAVTLSPGQKADAVVDFESSGARLRRVRPTARLGGYFCFRRAFFYSAAHPSDA
jgi:hypothetical protein